MTLAITCSLGTKGASARAGQFRAKLKKWAMVLLHPSLILFLQMLFKGKTSEHRNQAFAQGIALENIHLARSIHVLICLIRLLPFSCRYRAIKSCLPTHAREVKLFNLLNRVQYAFHLPVDR